MKSSSMARSVSCTPNDAAFCVHSARSTSSTLAPFVPRLPPTSPSSVRHRRRFPGGSLTLQCDGKIARARSPGLVRLLKCYFQDTADDRSELNQGKYITERAAGNHRHSRQPRRLLAHILRKLQARHSVSQGRFSIDHQRASGAATQSVYSNQTLRGMQSIPTIQTAC